VSLASLLPVRFGLFDRSHRQPKHRASDEVTRLQHKLAGAELLMAGYRIQLDDLHRNHAETIARIDERHGEIVRGLEQQIAELEHRLNVGVLAEHVVAKTQEIPIPPDLQARFAAGRAVTLEHSPQAVPPPNLPPWAAEDRTAIHFPQARP
jgi:hypothetical protein